MNLTDLKLVRLEENITFKAFSCSDEDLNDFLFADAKNYTRELLATTFLFENESDIVAYFSVFNDRVNLKTNDNNSRNRVNRSIPNMKRINNYPAIKVGRLAVSENYMSHHIGSQILTIVKQWFKPNKMSGCRFITVDAYAAAIPFYQKNGFNFLTKNDEGEDTRLMYYDLMKFI